MAGEQKHERHANRWRVLTTRVAPHLRLGAVGLLEQRDVLFAWREVAHVLRGARRVARARQVAQRRAPTSAPTHGAWLSRAQPASIALTSRSCCSCCSSASSSARFGASAPCCASAFCAWAILRSILTRSKKRTCAHQGQAPQRRCAPARVGGPPAVPPSLPHAPHLVVADGQLAFPLHALGFLLGGVQLVQLPLSRRPRCVRQVRLRRKGARSRTGDCPDLQSALRHASRERCPRRTLLSRCLRSRMRSRAFCTPAAAALSCCLPAPWPLLWGPLFCCCALCTPPFGAALPAGLTPAGAGRPCWCFAIAAKTTERATR